MKLIENGDFNVKIKLRNRNEIGQLARTFNNMTRKVNKLINEVYVDKITQKELEVQMLQNQINPHFLYNTLESIHMMAEINEDEETSTMVRALGRILRYGISKKHEKVTVKQELDNINDYILLQKIRFSNIFDIKVNIDPNLYDFIIIKLIFQPLVENAIYHGLDETLSGGLIEITGEKSDNNLIFMVKDNGKGMDESSVIKMNNNLNDVDNSMSSIGLKNVSRRIKLKYGNDYGLEVSSVLGEYTAVKILLPAVIKNS
jgi:two-component system sensor histidine kinase YesM